MTRSVRTFLVLAALVASMGAFPAAHAAGAPSVRLLASRPEVTIERRRHHQPVSLDVGVFVASIGAPFEIRATQPHYGAPIDVIQWLDHGSTTRPLPADVADGWNGLSNFLHVHAAKDGGATVSNASYTFCPANYDRQRVDDSGPDVADYPRYGCSVNPFTLGAVWGIEKGWAVNVSDNGYYYFGPSEPGPILDAPDGHYVVRFSISKEYRDLFDIPALDASVTVGVTLVTTRHCSSGCSGSGSLRGGQHASSTGVGPSHADAHVPTVQHPDPATEPDLIPLPSWLLSTRHDRRSGSDQLVFGATVWDAGPSPMVVEGFRRPGTDTMDAYQYFYLDGSPVGRAPVGTLEFDAHHGHQHWHFEQFARYSLLDGRSHEVVVSRKVSFCLAPTDPIDLTRPGANWSPSYIGLATACGDENALWVREVLDAGWGDTYYQYLAGQSFNITDLPNGTYFVRVTANPTGRLFETHTANNTVDRRIIIRGTPGHRTVRVPPWHGINSG